jgi:hypothetical protein
MNEVMTRTEVEALYPNEWILMADPEPGTDVNYRGRVVAHDKDKTELLRKAKGLSIPRRVAIFFAGPPIPQGMKAL